MSTGTLPEGSSRLRAPVLARTVVHVAVLLVLATVYVLAHVARDPLDGDSAMYGTIAKTIVTTGEWSRLSFNGEPYFNKPPLHFWLNASVFSWLPPTTWTASLVPSLLVVVDTLVLYALCRVTLGGWQPAFFAGVVFVTTPEVLHWGRGVRLESLLALWMLFGLWAAYASVTRPATVVWLGTAVAGGWLTKGPQGLLPLAVAPLVWVRAGVLGARLRSGWTYAALGMSVGVVGTWVWLRSGEPGFLGVYFGDQVADALLRGGWFDRGPLWYVGKLLRTYWPWLPFAFAGMVVLWRRRRESVGASVWLACVAVVMVVISSAAVKKSRYLFPIYPALSATAGVALAALAIRLPRLPAIVAGGASLGAVVLLVLGGSAAAPRPHVRDALVTARLLPAAAPALLSYDAQHGQPDVAKILGFHSAVLLTTCRADCVDEVAAGSGAISIVARRVEADRVAAAVGGVVVQRNDTLAIIAVPSSG